MRRRNSYSYKGSYGKGYRRSSYRGYGSYGDYGRNNHSSLKIIIIILICLLLAGGGVFAAAYFGLFGDTFRIGKEPEKSVLTSKSESSAQVSKAQNSEKKKEKEPVGKWIENVYLYGTNAFEPFNEYQNASKEYAKTINSVRKELDSSINIYTILAPSHSLTGLPDKYRSQIGSDEKKSIENIYAAIDKKIRCINVCDTLQKHSGEYTYFRTDTNWTALGAYYAYEQFCKSAKTDCIDLKKLESGKIDGFKGSLFAATVTDEKPDGNDVLAQNPDSVIYYKTNGYCRLLENGESEDREVTMIAEFASGSNAYSAFIWGNNPYMKIETDIETDRKLCIIKDSFGCAFAPFTATAFKEVFIVDPAYYEGNVLDYIKENNYTDVLFLNSSSSANTLERVNELKTIL